jgi:hypothetical protein
MIQTDLTEVLKAYCGWDNIVRDKHLRYAETIIEQHTIVIYKGVEYRLLEDLKVDLDAECIDRKD